MSIECYDKDCSRHIQDEPICHEERCIKCCPHCGEEDYIPMKVIWNVENYGSRVYDFRCTKCNKLITAQLNRQVSVIVVSVRISDKKIDDWGE